MYISFCNRRGWRLVWSHQAGDAPLRGEWPFSARLQEELSWSNAAALTEERRRSIGPEE